MYLPAWFPVVSHCCHQLEASVTKLQTELGLSPEDVNALPPPLARIRELEQENARLLKENEELRRMVSGDSGRPLQLPELSRRGPMPGPGDMGRDLKRRKISGDLEDLYMVRPFSCI